ncbi:MAG: hypothetical protein H0X66_00405 [Verrucomicrobia bacterium]|nr:hypothetical protein [Verrucomicrobiota bacterium]
MKNILTIGFALSIAIVSAHSQVLLSGGATYQQNFDSLASSVGTNTTVAWTNNTALKGWYASSKAKGDYKSYRVSGGEMNNGWIYSFGTNAANAISDRAFGSIASGTPEVIAFGVRFKNDTDKTMTKVLVSYNGEQWRNSTDNGADQTLTFAFRTASSTLTNAEPGITENWTPVKALDFTRLNYGGDAGPLDGNAKANRKEFTNVELAGVKLKPGEELFLRWEDVDDLGQSDHGLAVDDLKVSFTE